MTKVKVHFLGASGTVTGSKYLIEAFDRKIMIDCGLFQGLKNLRLLNWDTMPINIPEVDLVLLTHGHLDHCGYLPKLVKQGFKGKILASRPTIDIAKIILRDSGKIQDEEAERANLQGYSKHSPARPLYSLADTEMVFDYFKIAPEGEWIELFENISVRFQYAGHIIGACFIELKIGNQYYIFSGDLGRDQDVLMRAPQKPERADVLFIESTYGDRLHKKNDTLKNLVNIVKSVYEQKGTLIIPSFAVERAQSLMYHLWMAQVKGLLPAIPVFMDSPMGKNVLDVFHKYPEWHKLSAGDCKKMCAKINIVDSYRETMRIRDNPKPKIIIAGSGMITGGRVLSYLERYLGNESATILLVGYQAEGTRGRDLQNGASEIKIYGKYYKVKAQVKNIDGLSAHADQNELLDWLSEIKDHPKKIFITHGEPKSALALKDKIFERYGWNSSIPELYEVREIGER